ARVSGSRVSTRRAWPRGANGRSSPTSTARRSGATVRHRRTRACSEPDPATRGGRRRVARPLARVQPGRAGAGRARSAGPLLGVAIDPRHAGEKPARPSRLARLRLDTRPLRHPTFRRLWIGQAVSSVGGEIGVVAVPYQVYSLTHSTAAVGLLGVATLVPLVTVSFVGGALADALDRRTVLLRTEVGMAVVTGLFLANALLPHPQLWVLYVLQALAMAIFSLGRPGLGGLLIAGAGVPWTYGIDLATYAASFVALWALPKLPPVTEVERPGL